MVQKVFKNKLFVLSIEINGTKVIRKIFRLEKEIDNQVLEYESNEDYYWLQKAALNGNYIEKFERNDDR